MLAAFSLATSRRVTDKSQDMSLTARIPDEQSLKNNISAESDTLGSRRKRKWRAEDAGRLPNLEAWGVRALARAWGSRPSSLAHITHRPPARPSSSPLAL